MYYNFPDLQYLATYVCIHEVHISLLAFAKQLCSIIKIKVYCSCKNKKGVGLQQK